MKYKISKTGLKLIIVYVALVLLACIFLLATIETNTFAYLYLIFLTIPWSLILAVITILCEGVGEISSFHKLVIFGIFCMLNCAIIGWLGLKYDSKKEAGK